MTDGSHQLHLSYCDRLIFGLIHQGWGEQFLCIKGTLQVIQMNKWMYNAIPAIKNISAVGKEGKKCFI